MSKKSKFRMSDHIGEESAPVEPVVPTKAPVKLLYDTWDETGKRVAAGAVIELPPDIARRLIEAGKVERADPLPGE